MGLIDDAVGAIQAGWPVILPTDTVYGLCSSAEREAAARRLAELKQRAETQPSALLAADLDHLLERIPELRGRSATIARSLLPGAYTLVFQNPARRFRWLTGDRPDTIGVRVPALTGDAQAIVAHVGAVAATSANLHGGADPRRVDDVPDELREACAFIVDAGELPGTPSTVVDFTGPDPRVLREGAGSVEQALAAARQAVAT